MGKKMFQNKYPVSPAGIIGRFIYLKRLFLFLSISFFFSNSAFAQEVILKVAYDHWPPWKITTGGKIDGIDAQLLYAIEKKSDLRFEFIVAPWRRCIEMFKKGEVDMITSFIENEERQGFTAYIHPSYFIDSVRFYGLQHQNFQIETYDDLYQYRIGGVKGAHYYDKFDRDPAMRVERVVHEKQLIKMLVSGRIDLIVDWETPLDYLINELNKQEVIKKYTYDFFSTDKEEDNFIRQSASFLAFSKKSKNLKYKDQIGSILASMMEKDEINTLINTFIQKNMETNEPQINHP